jgi:hypothetical protein
MEKLGVMPPGSLPQAKCRLFVSQFRLYPPAMPTMIGPFSNAPRLLAQLVFAALRHCEGIVAYRLDSERHLQGQEVGKGFAYQPIRDQGGPCRFHHEQLGGSRFGEERGAAGGRWSSCDAGKGSGRAEDWRA